MQIDSVLPIVYFMLCWGFAAPNVNIERLNDNIIFRKDPAKIPLDNMEESKSDSDRTESTITGWQPITAKAEKVTIVSNLTNVQ